MSQLDRIEQKLDQILALLNKPKRTVTRKPVAYPSGFESLWTQYPKRNGSNPKNKAFSAYNARLKQGVLYSDIADGLKRYAGWCDATNKTGTELVMQAARFFGPGEEWAASRVMPAPQVIKVPSELNALVKFAAGRGLTARPGEDQWEFKNRVEQSI